MRRISEINHTLKKIVEAYNVNYILAELPHGSQNASAARMIGMVAGVLQTISDWTDRGIEWYSEADAKKAVLGKISATKKEMVDAMVLHYSNSWRTGVKYKDEAIADALAIHFVAMEQSPVLKFWK
jgi:Holliday junction resolvasome RuvABC endonuclease subunit